ncbi:MAG TPA: S41 family peptidase [Thermodesulfobacteriota bacterium]|nr:S41 family peptidase [Thermodesulfobacteriota bacterium]
MKRFYVPIFSLLLFASGVSALAEEATYKGLSDFTRVLDIIERNYVEEVDPEELTVGAIEGMLKTLDPYSVYLTPERYNEIEIGTSGEFGGVGMEVTIENDVLTVITPIEDTPAAKAGIKPKDQIIAIDGKPTRGMAVHEAVKILRGPKGSSVKITVQSEGKSSPRDITLVREIIRVESVKSKLLNNGIGYIRLSQFQEKTSQELRNSLTQLESQNGGRLKGVVLDLRNNPGGLLTQAVEVVDEFIDQGLIVSVKGRAETQSTDYYATKKGKFQDYPLVVIVNKGSASASEVVAEALQDSKRASILGTKTFGKGSVQTIIRLDNGAGLKLTTAKFYAPSGRSINEVGVIPDIVVENTESKDLQLERALELLGTSKAENTIPKG